MTLQNNHHGTVSTVLVTKVNGKLLAVTRRGPPSDFSPGGHVDMAPASNEAPPLRKLRAEG
jgi:hypothetical protein